MVIRYFSASSHLSLNVWTTDDSTALETCGHCDNCTRLPGHVDHQDVTLEAWQILKVSDQIRRSCCRATVNMLADLVRGLGHWSIAVSGGKTGEKDKFHVDIDDIAGGKIGLNKDVSGSLWLFVMAYPQMSTAHGDLAYPAFGGRIFDGIVSSKLLYRQCIYHPRTSSPSTHSINPRRCNEREGPESNMLVQKPKGEKKTEYQKISSEKFLYKQTDYTQRQSVQKGHDR